MIIYDPRFNRIIEMTLPEVSQKTGYAESSIATMLSKGLNKIMKGAYAGCYIFREKPARKVLRQIYTSVTYEDEIWRDYTPSDEVQVSNYGRVRRADTNGHYMYMPYFKKNSMGRSNKNQSLVGIYVDGRKKTTYVSNMVAKCFLEGEGLVVHKNGIIYDNRADNLEYVSAKYLGKKFGGMNSKSVPLVQLDTDTLEVIEYYKSGREASKRIGYISGQCIFDFINGTYKACGGLLFLREDVYDYLVDNDLLTREYIDKCIVGKSQKKIAEAIKNEEEFEMIDYENMNKSNRIAHCQQLKMLRQSTDLTAKKLGEMVGVAKTTIAHVETGRACYASDIEQKIRMTLYRYNREFKERNEELKNAGAMIRIKRKEKDIAMSELAASIGISTPTLSRFEVGTQICPEEMRKKILKAIRMWNHEARGIKKAV